MSLLRVVLTKHAKAMLHERNIQQSWVEATIKAPDIVENDPDRPPAVRAFRKISENNGRVLRVVYIAERETARVVTAFFDRARKI